MKKEKAFGGGQSCHGYFWETESSKRGRKVFLVVTRAGSCSGRKQKEPEKLKVGGQGVCRPGEPRGFSVHRKYLDRNRRKKELGV